MIKFRILVTINILSRGQEDSFPEGMPCCEPKKYISSKGFATFDDAEDSLRKQGYAQGSGFWGKEEMMAGRKCWLSAEILEVI